MKKLTLTLALAALAIAVLVPAGGARAEQVTYQDMVRILGDVVVPAHARVQSNAVAILGSVTVHGTVNGDVVAVLGDVVLSPTAVVIGDIVTVGGALRRSPEAQVRGQITEVSFGRIFAGGLGRLGFPVVPGVFRVFYVAGLFALALVLWALAPRHVDVVVSTIAAEPARSALWGLTALVLLLPLVIVLSITIIGIPVALAVVLAAVLARFMGYVALSLFLGHRLTGAVCGGDAGLNPAWVLLVGTVTIGVITAVPGVGWLVSLALTLVGTGAVLMSKFGTGRPWFNGSRRPRPDENPGPGPA